MKTFYTLLLTSFLFACGAGKQTTAPKDDGLITIKIIQLNDVYEIAPLGGGLYGGLARVAHVRDSILTVNPNTYTVMAGDFLNPSLIGTLKYKGERIAGRQMVEVLNALGMDLVTFGNHEFDQGKEALQNRINESNFFWTSANVMENSEEGIKPFSKQNDLANIPLKKTHIATFKDADGTLINVGFAGVTINSNPQDFVVYQDVTSSMQEALNDLGPKTDFVLGLTHLKVSDDKKLATDFPTLKFIMGGHEHNSMLVNAGSTKIAKADANAKTIYVHTLSYNKNSGELRVASELFPIDNSIKDQPKTAAVINKWQDILEAKVKEVVPNPDQVIYTANVPLDGTDSASRGVQTNLGGIITTAMAAAFKPKVDAALVNGGSIRIDDQLSGDITSLDVFRVLPFGGGILKVDISGDLLIQVLDFSILKRGTGAYLQRFNIDKNSIGSWEIGNKAIDPEAIYKVAFSDFLLKGYDIPFLTPDNPGVLGIYEPAPHELAFDIRKAIVYYLSRN